MGNSSEVTVRTTAWSVDAGKLNSAATKLWNGLGDGGARVVEQLDTDEGFRQRTLQFMLSGGFTSANEQMARLVLGKRLITAQQVMDKRRPVKKEGQEKEIEPLIYSADQLAFIQATVPSLEELEFLRDQNYGLVPLPPRSLNLLDIRELKPSLFCTEEGGWYAEEVQEFVRTEVVQIADTAWLAIRMDHVPNSTNSTWDQQRILLSSDEEVPQAVAVAWFDTLFAEVHGVRPHKDVWVRTASLTARRDRVNVGFGSGRFGVNSNTDGNVNPCLGVSASRKFKKLES